LNSNYSIYHEDSLILEGTFSGTTYYFGTDAGGLGKKGGGGARVNGTVSITLSSGSFVAFIDDRFVYSGHNFFGVEETKLSSDLTCGGSIEIINDITAGGNIDADGVITASSGFSTSDDRIKANESLIENSTETIMKLTPQLYDKYTTFDTSGNFLRCAGFIAQEIYYNAPELRDMVKLNTDASGNVIVPYEFDLSNNDLQNDPDYNALNWGDEPVSINYDHLIPYLVKSNQEQQTEIESLKSIITSLTSRLDALESSNA
jgi:hypothetical protein